MKLYLTKVRAETSQAMALNKDIDWQKLAGLLLDEWVAQNLKAKVPAR